MSNILLLSSAYKFTIYNKFTIPWRHFASFLKRAWILTPFYVAYQYGKLAYLTGFYVCNPDCLRLGSIFLTKLNIHPLLPIPSINLLTPHYQEAFPSLDGDEITEKFKGLLLVSVGAKNNLHLCYGSIYILLNNSTKHLLAPDKDGSLVIMLCIRKY